MRLKAVLSLDGTLSSKEREKRTQFFIFACAGLFACAISFASSSGGQLSNPVRLCGTCMAVLGSAIAFSAVLCRVPLTTRLVVGILYLVTSGILMWDLHARTISSSRWPLLVIIIDMLLVMQVPHTVHPRSCVFCCHVVAYAWC